MTVSDGHLGEERPFTQRALVLWAVAWRPASGGSWDILHDDGAGRVEDKRFAERRSQVWAEKFPDHLYQPLPMEGRP